MKGRLNRVIDQMQPAWVGTQRNDGLSETSGTRSPHAMRAARSFPTGS
jgi:hypothetical protein